MGAGKWPSLWKCSIITPAYKSGNPESVKIINLLAFYHSSHPFTHSWEIALPTHLSASSKLNLWPATWFYRKALSSNTTLALLRWLTQQKRFFFVSRYAAYFQFPYDFDLFPYHKLLQKLASFSFDEDVFKKFQTISFIKVATSISHLLLLSYGGH